MQVPPLGLARTDATHGVVNRPLTNDLILLGLISEAMSTGKSKVAAIPGITNPRNVGRPKPGGTTAAVAFWNKIQTIKTV